VTLTIIHNNQKQEKPIPVSWDQVTFGQFLKLGECGSDRIKVLSLFTGIDYETLKKSKIIGLDRALAALLFLEKAPEPRVPKEILGYPVPENLEFEQVQMYLDLKTYLEESKGKTPEEQLAQYTLYCAVYAVPHWKQGQYSWEFTEKLAPLFLNAPCTEVMGIGNFTLAKLIGLKHDIKIDYHRRRLTLQVVRLTIKGFMLNIQGCFQRLLLKKKLV
jgi:hypothetical protein